MHEFDATKDAWQRLYAATQVQAKEILELKERYMLIIENEERWKAAISLLKEDLNKAKRDRDEAREQCKSAIPAFCVDLMRRCIEAQGRPIRANSEDAQAASILAEKGYILGAGVYVWWKL